jgi:ATP-dependent RNA helicase SUPV3L1/SUV3
MGWLPAGSVLLRLDVAERIAAELGFLTRRAPAPPPPDLASRLGVKADTLGVTLAALGFRLLEPVPLEEGMYGPPMPLRVAQPRPQHHHYRGSRPGGPPQQAHGQGRPQRERRPQHGQTQGRPEAAPAEPRRESPFYGPPIPPELRPQRGPRPEQGQRHGARPWQGKGQPRHGGPRQGEGRGEGQRAGHGGGNHGQRQDQPRQPYQGRDQGPPGRSEPRKPPEPRINPDSPFAILAKLKLR